MEAFSIRRFRAAIVVAISAFATILLTACGGQSQPGYPFTPVVPESKGATKAPDFQIVAYQGEDVLGGKEVRLSDLLAQGKPVVLNMWAGLCPPCRAEMPDLQEVYEQYEGRIVLFGLDVGPFVGLGSREDGRALLRELKVTYPNGTTFDSGVVQSYRILGMPATYFIKPTREIHRTWTGLLTKSKMVELVEELLAASSAR